MGNKPVKLGLHIEEKDYTAGSLVKGRVYLSVHQEQQANGLHLRLVGEECSTIAYDVHEHHDYNRNTNTIREVERCSSSLVHLDVALTHFKTCSIKPGQYEYPFEWELPENLPSSMYCRKGDSHCEIRYNMTAYLHKNGAFGEQPQYSAEHTICLSAQPSRPLNTTRTVMEPEVFPIKTCCFDQGKVMMGWDTSTTVASPDDVVELGISGSNSSSIQIEYLQARWLETVSWSAHGRTEEWTRSLSEMKISTSNMPQWSSNSRSCQQANFPSSYERLGETGNARVVAQLLLPQDARDSYAGTLVRVRHSLVITALTPGGCCVTSPESGTLVHIQRKVTQVPSAPDEAPYVHTTAHEVSAPPGDEPAFVEANLLPDDWRPQEAHVVTLPMSSAVLLESPPASSAPDESLLRESHSIATNLTELEASLSTASNPVNVISEHLNNPTMVATIQNLTPREFVQVVQSATRDMPTVARLIAGAMDEHFQCRHVLACLWALPPDVRMEVMRQVAPLASDLESQKSMIEKELDPNELIHFRAALK